MTNVKTSTIVSTQLPDFVRNDYPVFVTFLEKYYEWLETQQNVSSGIRQLQLSTDIDEADAYYLDKLKNDLLPYFPQEVISDKRLFLKLVTQFYKSSGTQDSIKFLFRALFNENISIYYPKDDILIASDGKWILPLALRVDTNDLNIFNIENTLIVGQTSKATAIVEKVIQSVDRQLGITYIELYVSNVKRLFSTGENVIANYINPVTNLNVTVSAKLIGSLSEIKIDPRFRGAFYNGGTFTSSGFIEGDPVTIVGGLNPDAANPIGAIAYVGETTSGGVENIFVTNGGFGFRNPLDDLYADTPTSLVDFIGGFVDAPSLGQEAKATVTLVDTANTRSVNVSTMTVSLLHGSTATIAQIEASTVQNVSTYSEFSVHPISFVLLDTGGGGYRQRPTIKTYSFYNEDYSDSLIIPSAVAVKGTKIIVDATPGQDLTADVEPGDYVRLFVEDKFEEVREVVAVTASTLFFSEAFSVDIGFGGQQGILEVYKINRNDLYKIGSLGRIQVVNGGTGYQNGDIIIFTGGSGYGANGYVNVSGGVITSATINAHSANAYVIGGEGYTNDSLPTLSVQSASGQGAVLAVSEVTGSGDTYQLSTSRIGAITSLKISSFGYDYVSAPTISLRNADLLLTNVTEGQLFISNTVIYQGASNTNFTFRAVVDNYDDSTSTLRIFNYIGSLNRDIIIKYDSESAVAAVTANVVISQFYGDGNARATAKFENGLIRYPGIYLNTDGQPSADKRIQDGYKYHNYSYVIKSSTDYAKFKKPLNDIVHPLGTKTFAYKMDDNNENIVIANTLIYVTSDDLPDTYNVAINTSKIISTNVSANLPAIVNVGDVIVIGSVNRGISNTVNVVSGSNVIFGDANSVNFINDLQEGDTIFLSTGNTATVNEVVNVSHAMLSVTINVTSTVATINVIYPEVVKVNTVNANTIFTTTQIRGNGNNLLARIEKVR
jgi:hypothetical protein